MTDGFWTKADTRACEEVCQTGWGLSSDQLIAKAGNALAKAIAARVRPSSQLLALIGPGHNGDDTRWAARSLLDLGYQVTCVALKKTQPSEHAYEPGSLRAFADHDDLIILDGLFGIGFRPPLRDSLATSLLKEAQSLKATKVLAIDLPSGMNADAWDEEPPILPATTTFTFARAKLAHALSPSRQSCGEVAILRDVFPEESITPASLREVKLGESLSLHPWRQHGEDIHKYQRGHVAILGGSRGKWGALALASQAALRAGAGWVSVIPTSRDFYQECRTNFLPSVTFEDCADEESLLNFLDQRHVRCLVIGPGTVAQPLSQSLLHKLSLRPGKILLDAGALQGAPLISQEAELLLTPHPGEWARSGHEKLVSFLDLLALQKRLKNVHVLYKTATPLMIGPKLWAFCGGSKILASAGSGDALAGAIGALAAQGLSLDQASQCAIALLAAASEAAGGKLGPMSVTASDVIDRFGSVLNHHLLRG